MLNQSSLKTFGKKAMEMKTTALFTVKQTVHNKVLTRLDFPHEDQTGADSPHNKCPCVKQV
jgi:hypothetical protein